MRFAIAKAASKLVCFLMLKTLWFISFISILSFEKIRGNMCLASPLCHSIFEGVRRVISIWNFVRLYGTMMGSCNEILGSGVTSYPTYLDPWVPLFGIFSLWSPATPVKMNGYRTNSHSFCVWIFSIDWYLNWPYSNFTIDPWFSTRWCPYEGVKSKNNFYWFSKLFFWFLNQFRQKN